MFVPIFAPCWSEFPNDWRTATVKDFVGFQLYANSDRQEVQIGAHVTSPDKDVIKDQQNVMIGQNLHEHLFTVLEA